MEANRNGTINMMPIVPLPDPSTSSSEAQRKKMEDAAALQKMEIERNKKKQESLEKARIQAENDEKAEKKALEMKRKADEEIKKKEEEQREKAIKEQKSKDKALKEQQKTNGEKLKQEHLKQSLAKSQLISEIQAKAETDKNKRLQDLSSTLGSDQENKALFWERYNDQVRQQDPASFNKNGESIITGSIDTFINSNIGKADQPKYQLTKQEENGKSLVIPDLKSLLSIFNEFRINPGKYSGYIQDRFIDRLDEEGSHPDLFQTFTEGKGSFYEAISELTEFKPQNILEIDAGLCAAAYLRAKEQAESNSVNTLSDLEAEKFGLRWVNQGSGIGIAELNTVLNKLDYQDLVAILFSGDGDFVRHNRVTLAKAGFWNIGFGIYQRKQSGMIFCTVYLSGEGFKSETSKIPKSIMANNGMEQYLKSK